MGLAIQWRPSPVNPISNFADGVWSYPIGPSYRSQFIGSPRPYTENHAP